MKPVVGAIIKEENDTAAVRSESSAGCSPLLLLPVQLEIKYKQDCGAKMNNSQILTKQS